MRSAGSVGEKRKCRVFQGLRLSQQIGGETFGSDSVSLKNSALKRVKYVCKKRVSILINVAGFILGHSILYLL